MPVFEAVTAVLFVINVVVVWIGIVDRYFLNVPAPWVEEVARLQMVALAFIGGAVAWRRGQHVTVDAFVMRLGPVARRRSELLANLLVALFLTAVFYYSFLLAIKRLPDPAPVTRLSLSLYIWPVPVGTGLMLLMTLPRLYEYGLRELLQVGLPLAAFLLAATETISLWSPIVLSLDPLLVLFLGFFLLLLMNVPIAMCLGIPSVVYIFLLGGFDLEIFVQRMVSGIDSFILLAVPFFILAGALMEIGGIAQRLVALAVAVIGHVRGGLAQVVVVSEVLFADISGSRAAETSAMTALLLPSLVRAGYEKKEALAVMASAESIGMVVPPSISTVILATLTNLSVATLFAAGLLPAVVLAAVLIVLVAIKARRGNWPAQPRSSPRHVAASFLQGLIPLAAPVIIVGSILGGIVTVTESASVAVAYALVVGGLIYRQLQPRAIVKQVIAAGTTTGMVFWLIGTASVFAWILARQQVPLHLTQMVQSLAGGVWVFLLFSVLVFLLLSGLMDNVPTMLIFTPVLYPIAHALHVDLVHYSVMILIAMGMGLFLPPVGNCLFLACAIARVKPASMMHPMLPYLGALFVGLAIVASVPAVTLTIPHLLGLH